jgi:hypothetical protein
MMNANVRRLVFDLSPRKIVWLQLFFLLLLIPISIDFWDGDYRTGIWIVANSGLCTLLYVNKFSTWQILPVTDHEIRKSQFWVIFGTSCFMPVVFIIFGIGLAAHLGPPKISPRGLLAFISAVIFLGSSVGFYIFIRQISRPIFGNVNSEFLSSIPLIVSFSSVWPMGYGGNQNVGYLNFLISCGVVSLSLVLAALIWNRKLPLVLPLNPKQSLKGRYTELSSTASSRLDRTTARRSGVWALLASSLGHLARNASIGLGVFATVVLATNYGLLQAFESPMLVLQFAPLLCAFLAFPALMEPQRVRGGLPVSALGRTLALHLVVPALLLPTWVLMIALGALLHPEGMTPRWWIGCGMTSLLAWSFIAIARPVALRLGRLGVGLISGVFTMLVGIISGLGTREGRDDGSMSLAIIGLLIITLIAGWVWTYVELAYWRKAYQSQGLAADHWRGAAT